MPLSTFIAGNAVIAQGKWCHKATKAGFLQQDKVELFSELDQVMYDARYFRTLLQEVGIEGQKNTIKWLASTLIIESLQRYDDIVADLNNHYSKKFCEYNAIYLFGEEKTPRYELVKALMQFKDSTMPRIKSMDCGNLYLAAITCDTRYANKLINSVESANRCLGRKPLDVAKEVGCEESIINAFASFSEDLKDDLDMTSDIYNLMHDDL